MNPTERSSHPSRAQIDALMDFLEENPSLAKGFSKVPSARDAARTKWERCAHRLNSIGGSVKTWKQWTKYWADKKSAVKKKAALRSAARRKTGGGIEEVVVDLTEAEERILSLIPIKPPPPPPPPGEGFAEGDRHLGIDPFLTLQPSTSQPLQSFHTQDRNIIPAVSPIDVSEATNQLATDSPILYAEVNVVSIAGASDSTNNRPSLILPAPVARVPAEAVSPPPDRNDQHSPPQPHDHHHATPQPYNSPIRRTQSPRRNTTPRHRRRLLPTPAFPPSQRRSQFASLTERFLAVEEQRLQLDGRNTAVSEEMSVLLEALLQRERERDREMSQGLLAIAEGLKLLAEALNK